MNKWINISFLGVITLLIAFSCKKEVVRIEPDSNVDNPYDDIDYGNNPDQIPIDSASYLGLHKFIFEPKCAVPACHDGAFEPDFRTIQGSYNQLVFHNVIKNNQTNSFTYRVVPGDTAMSWLHERVTTNNQTLGRMPLYDNALSSQELKNLETWILNGAKDIFGNTPSIPDFQPTTGGFLAFLNDTSGIRLDTARANIIAPMQLPQNSTVQLWFLLYDTDASGNFIPGAFLTHNKIKISNNLYNFSGSAEQPLVVRAPTSPMMLPVAFNPNINAPYYHSYTLNTANFNVGETYYMRIYVKDANHTNITELPENGSQIYLLTYFSFIVQ